MRLFKLALLIASTHFLASCGSEKEQTFSILHEGSEWTVKFADETNIDHVKSLVTDALNNADEVFSDNSTQSFTHQFNQKNNTEPFEVSREFSETLRLSKMISDSAKGCFDITVEPVNALWLHKENKPQKEAISDALSYVGNDKYLAYGSFVRKLNPGVQITLSRLMDSIRTKAVAEKLIASEIRNFSIISSHTAFLSGSYDIKEKSTPVSSDDLAKQLATLTTAPTETFATVSLEDNHTLKRLLIDARTGKPVSHGPLTVTVLHDDVVRAQAWANSLLCLGEDEGMVLAKANSIKAFFVKRPSAKQTVVSASFMPTEQHNPSN
tara:strand:+ start:2137 stop:3108 length:972 start_codon:yes stop_codon:yes gene_type:complete